MRRPAYYLWLLILLSMTAAIARADSLSDMIQRHESMLREELANSTSTTEDVFYSFSWLQTDINWHDASPGV